MMRIPLVHGLAARVFMLARIAAMHKPEPIAWHIGQHFPFGHRSVFPSGIDGLDIHDETDWECVGFIWNRGKTDDLRMRESTSRIFAAMDLPDVEKRDLGIHFRGHRKDGERLLDFVPKITFAMSESSGKIAMLCDSQRAKIGAILGDRAITQKTHEMTSDMDRGGLDVRQFILEWWQLLNCKRVISNCPQSSLLFPLAFSNAN